MKVLDTAPSFCNILGTTGQGVPREGEEKLCLESWVIFCKTSSFMTMEEGSQKGGDAGLRNFCSDHISASPPFSV